MAKKGSSLSDKRSFWSGFHAGKKSGGSSKINRTDFDISKRYSTALGRKLSLSGAEIQDETYDTYDKMQGNKEFQKEMRHDYGRK